MTRAQTLIVTTALAAVLPLASAMAQTGGHPSTKCGAETFSTEKMMYVSVPCVGAEAVQQQGTVGAAAPSVTGTNSTTYTKAQMKQGEMYPTAMPSQAVTAGPSYAYTGGSCGARNAVAITDEYGHKYNCRGDRIR
jgi:hypothetical protein